MKYISLVLFSLLYFSTQAQDEPETVPGAPVLRIYTSSLYGRIIDAKTNKGIEAVSIQLYGGISYDSLITAMFTRPNGDFRFEGINFRDSIKIVMTGIGYAKQEQYTTFPKNNNGPVTRDLGNILLLNETQLLSNVTINSDRRALEMGIDRKIFHVDQSLTATGGTASDVMKNIPSVSVDVDGNVTLRNSSPQIFVDGRPTILTPDQIPANDIEKIELITNPSAKFDAASTGGIINIVMKRNKRLGINGIASAGVGYPENTNGNLSLSIRQNKLNFFATGSYNRRGGLTDRKSIRQNKENDIIDNYFNQTSVEERSRRFTSARFGLDFFMDNRNTISLTQGIVKGIFSNVEEQEQEFLNSSKVLERYGLRNSNNINDFNRYNTQLNFVHKFPREGRQLTANINYNYGKGKNTADILNLFFNPDGTSYSDPSLVKNLGSNDNNQMTFQIDFEDPKSDEGKLETGIRSYINNYTNLFDAYSVSNGNETLLPLSSHIEYRETVNAFYITYSGKKSSVSYQAGLRAEHSKFEGKLIDTGKEFGYSYPDNLNGIFDALFPSLFLTKEINDDNEMQLNYSRKIRRPNFWQLNPFVNINDPLNISQGNPQLKPEFTNSIELNFGRKYKSGEFQASVYYHNTTGDITRYSDTITALQYQQLNDAAIEPNAILNTFINANSMNRLGMELTLQHKINKDFSITPSINGEFQKVVADIEGTDLSNSGFNWEASILANYKINTATPSFFNKMGFQIEGDYESPRINPQGKELAEYSVDFAVRKDFLKKEKASITFSINDLFWTDKEGTIYDTENFYQESSRKNQRSFRLTLSYKFGDSEFKLNQRNNEEGAKE